MSITTLKIQGSDRFTLSAHEAIHIAQHEAVSMDATRVEPEHLLLGIIMHGDDRAMQILSSLGMDVRAVRARVAEISQSRYREVLDGSELPLSRDAQECIGWALSFASHMHTPLVSPDHLLLGVLRHSRTQPLLAFLLPPRESLQRRISEEVGSAYTSYIDQFINTRVRDQSVVSYRRGMAQRVLRKLERPSLTFADLVGLSEAKRGLREIIDFMKDTPLMQLSGGRIPHGVLLVDATSNERRFLAQAMAGEAVVPLISFSMLALVEMLVDLRTGSMHFEDLELPVDEYNLLKRGSIPEKGQRYIQHIFREAQNVAPSLLFIEDIDAIARLGRNEGHEELVHQLLVEIDALDKHYRVMVIGSAQQLGDVDPVLLKIGRFERQLILGNNVSLARVSFCSSCKREIQPDWQYCIYCGMSLAKVCPQCGSLYSSAEGARFCPVCGSALGA